MNIEYKKGKFIIELDNDTQLTAIKLAVYKQLHLYEQYTWDKDPEFKDDFNVLNEINGTLMKSLVNKL